LQQRVVAVDQIIGRAMLNRADRLLRGHHHVDPAMPDV
jgi:hypothetical protein